VLACREDDVFVTDVELEPRCGGDGPVKLLDLADDEEAWQVYRHNEADDVVVMIGPASHEPGEEYSLRSVVVSACGDDVREVAPNLDSVFVWEGALLGCDVDRNLVQPDGVDDLSPAMLVRRGCDRVHTESAIIAYDAAFDDHIGRLVAIRSLGDGTVMVETLVEGVVVLGGETSVYRPHIQNDKAYVRMPDLSVHAVDLATGTSTVLIADVVSTSISPSHILYQSASAVQDDLAPLVLRDRESGTEVVLVEAFPTEQGRTLADNHVKLEGPDHWGDPSARRWFWTSDGREFVAPGGTQIMTVLADGAVWLNGYDEASYESELLRWRESKLPERVLSCRDCVDVTHNYWRGGVQIRRGASIVKDTQLWFVRDEGGAAELLAGRVSRDFLQLADDRVLTVLGGDEEHGELVLHDYRDASQRTLHPRVGTAAIFLTMLFNVEGDVLYQVDDAERGHALYHALLAPVH
jgi:hypothetical protein